MADAYWQAITVLEAQEALIQLRVSDYPGMKKDNRMATHKQFHKLAYPKTHDAETVTTEQLAERIKAAIRG